MTSSQNTQVEQTAAAIKHNPFSANNLASSASAIKRQQATLATSQLQQLIEQMHSTKLGLQGPQGFQAVPVSFTPWQLSAKQFGAAQKLAQLLGQLQAKAAEDPDWLLAQTEQLASSDTVPGEIWRRLKTLSAKRRSGQNHSIKSRNLMLNRHDFLLDQHQQWRWVESNPIAAGMGPLNAAYLKLWQHHLQGHYAPNDATALQATLLAQAAIQQAQHTTTSPQQQPLMLIVVEANEDNIFDQQLLCNEVERLGVQVQRVTVAALLQAGFNSQQQLTWQQQRVDLLYWRTGYNPGTELDDNVWVFRTRLEQSAVAQCPTLAGQLTGSKWFQHQLTALILHNPAAVASQFGLSAADLRILQQAVVPSSAISDLTQAQAEQLIAQGYWYKTQQEGGGNVARGEDARQQLTKADSADLLMAPIDCFVRAEAFTSLRGGNTHISTGHITELGIFSLGTEALYGGYLCRTKDANSNEGGVHRGGAVLDLVLLQL
ncbi:hypothetical protein [Rheinheimera sp. 4Y26]|uniref:hypothetical protein n=1 Tax=Rheinheimera sp. 4Y26 TaxID=2977811 RepID=UPI0021B11FBC|nr:hypothetical protein [Rheinheimera sp. 4Y26]MCT6701232.1 hypothetical protein [Rheinheimera sp. 4Y26]